MVGGSGTTSRHSDAAGAGAADAGAATAIRVLDARLSISEALCDALCAGVGVGVGAGVGAGAAAAEPGVPSAAGGRTHRFDFSRTMVLVPGGRLAGALSRRLLARAKAACEPLFAPMIVTPKRFGPNLVAPTRPILGDVAALFSWREVLDRSIAAKDGFAARVAALFGMPEEPDPRVRMRIARRVCRLSAEVAASMGSLQSIATSAAARAGRSCRAARGARRVRAASNRAPRRVRVRGPRRIDPRRGARRPCRCRWTGPRGRAVCRPRSRATRTAAAPARARRARRGVRPPPGRCRRRGIPHRRALGRACVPDGADPRRGHSRRRPPEWRCEGCDRGDPHAAARQRRRRPVTESRASDQR